MMLETGKITEEEFNNRESELLNRLEQIEEYKKKHFEVVEEKAKKMSEDEDTVNEDDEESEETKIPHEMYSQQQ